MPPLMDSVLELLIQVHQLVLQLFLERLHVHNYFLELEIIAMPTAQPNWLIAKLAVLLHVQIRLVQM